MSTATPTRATLDDLMRVEGKAELIGGKVVKFLGTEGFANVQEVEVMPENVRFGLPPEIVEAIAAAPSGAAVE